MKITPKDIARFKELNALIKAGKATEEQVVEAKKLASAIKGFKDSKKEKRVGTNDIGFYNKYPALLKDAANVIFNEVAGTRFPATIGGINNINWPVVGAKFDVIFTPGKCVDSNSPFNYQMRQLWLALHRAYRGIGTYEYPDLGITIYSIFAHFADIARAERIYGICSKFSARNRSYPKAVLEALGVDSTTIDGSELADFRYQINRVITKASILCLPKGFTAFEAMITLMGNIFADASSPKAQWYLYDNPYLMKYDATFTTGGRVIYASRTKSNVSNTRQSLSDIIADLNTQSDLLLNDTDIARMCSDILKAFGENGITSVHPIDENFIIEPIEDEVRKLQLHNTHILGCPIGAGFSSSMLSNLGAFTTNLETLCIYQENGVIKHQMDSMRNSDVEATVAPSNFVDFGGGENKYARTSDPVDNYYFDNPILDTWKDDVSPDDVVEMSRQSIAFDRRSVTISGTTYYAVQPNNYSLYTVLQMTLYTNDPNSSTPYVLGRYGGNIIVNTTVNALYVSNVLIGGLSAIDWHPFIALSYKSGNTVIATGFHYDLDNYTLISKESLSRLHDACTLSLFKLDLVPQKE